LFLIISHIYREVGTKSNSSLLVENKELSGVRVESTTGGQYA
jgi:hypothetical protein